MSTLHIVGKKNSFTHTAAVDRYGDNHEFVDHTHHELVSMLLANEIPADQPSVVPLWNSNAGVIDMDKQTDTVNVFSGKAGLIYDLWAEPINYGLSIPGGKLDASTRFFSVKVAKDQCSRFLLENGVRTDADDDRFVGFATTTDAMTSFEKERQPNDGILCGHSLLIKNGQHPLKGDPTNPNNMTVFAVVGCLPNDQPSPTEWALGCFVTPIEGHELSTEFIDYYEDLVSKALRRQDRKGGMEDIPKVLFIVRCGSKVLMLVEMPGGSLAEAEWESPQADTEIAFESVSALQLSYSTQTANVMQEKFGCKKHAYYGQGSVYMWVSPPLCITVHGYDKDLVRDCARMQVLKLEELVNAGKLQISSEAQELLELAQVDLANLDLSPDSEPTIP